uniref:IMD domain-containing protein n=1 Tax=Castor canadensis TaxID=51338 RepID=A0A8C0ZPR6_CASCN
MSLSRSEEMHRLTENVYKVSLQRRAESAPVALKPEQDSPCGRMAGTIMEQFNPSLRNFIAMGKNYEKALAGVTFAAKGYFDALVKMGELASESQGSKELGKTLRWTESPTGIAGSNGWELEFLLKQHNFDLKISPFKPGALDPRM